MARLHVEASGTTATQPEAVWALLADASSYSRWGPWRSSGYDAGEPPQGRPGAIRRMRYGRRTVAVERLVDVEPGRRLTYTVIGGLPVRNYLAEVVLTPTDEGTQVRWVADWDRTLLGRIVHRKLQSLYPDIVSRLLAAAARNDEAPIG
jgi:uncharacterized protein YndB with AHSA1/START domain